MGRPKGSKNRAREATESLARRDDSTATKPDITGCSTVKEFCLEMIDRAEQRGRLNDMFLIINAVRSVMQL